MIPFKKKKKMSDEDRIKEMVAIMAKKEAKETPEDEAEESSEYQAMEDKMGVEKHDSKNHSSQEEIEEDFDQVKPNEDPSVSLAGPEDPEMKALPKKVQLFRKHPKATHIMIEMRGRKA